MCIIIDDIYIYKVINYILYYIIPTDFNPIDAQCASHMANYIIYYTMYNIHDQLKLLSEF